MPTAETNYTPNLGEFLELTSSGGPFPVFSFPGAPTGIVPENAIGIDESTGDFYQYIGGTWTLLFSTGGGGGGGTTEVATGTSDPVGAPAAGIIFFARTDVIRLLQWNGSAWVVVVSEV